MSIINVYTQEKVINMSDVDAATAMPATPEFVDPESRFGFVDLDYPMTFEGRTFSRIYLRRLSATEVSTFVETIQDKQNSKEIVRWPVTFDAAGAPIPDAVLAGLDDDDAFKLDEKLQDFLPRRFRTGSD